MKLNIIAENPSAGLGLIITKQVSQYKLGPLAIKNIYSDMRYKIQYRGDFFASQTNSCLNHWSTNSFKPAIKTLFGFKF